MSPADFCRWLKLLMHQDTAQGLTAAQTAMIRQRLADVFLHAIDPAFGDDAHLQALRHIHTGRADR